MLKSSRLPLSVAVPSRAWPSRPGLFTTSGQSILLVEIVVVPPFPPLTSICSVLAVELLPRFQENASRTHVLRLPLKLKTLVIVLTGRRFVPSIDITGLPLALIVRFRQLLPVVHVVSSSANDWPVAGSAASLTRMLSDPEERVL